jgi:hypothetical protein
MKNNFSTPGFSWLLLSAICVILILTGLNTVLKKTGPDKNRRWKIVAGTAFIILVWMGLLAIFSYQGFFADFSKLPPRPVLAVLIPLPFVLLIAFGKKFTQFLRSVPPQWLVFMQSFRIVVELLIWIAFMADKLPIQMTFEGKNLDMVTGVLALPVGYMLLRKKSYAPGLAVVFNIIGILLLLNILTIALLSMPTPLRYFMNEPSNSIVAQFPFILLPGLLVPVAYTLHIFSLRQLLTKK